MKETPIFEEVFSRVLNQPGFWIKVFIGGLLSFIPILNLLAFGYLFRLSVAIRRSGRITLPDWTDWPGLFIDGLKFAVVWIGFWLVPVLLALGIAALWGAFGLGAIGYLIFSLVFLLSPVLFSSALYRYCVRSDFRDLMDVPLILRMTFSEFSRSVLPALVFAGIFAFAAPLYGFALFSGFVFLISHTALSFRMIEQHRSVAL